MYWRTCSNSNPTVDTAYPRAQKCSPVKFLSLPHSRAMAMALFPLKSSMTEATGCLGGIAMHMCTRSSIRCPSRIWHSFCRANAWKISPSWRRVFPNNTLRRRLGTNTTWYLQPHLEWDRFWYCSDIHILLLSWFSASHLGGECYCGLRSDLFQSHWSNQWLTSMIVIS